MTTITVAEARVAVAVVVAARIRKAEAPRRLPPIPQRNRTQLKECVFKIGSAKKSNECAVNIKWLNEYLVRNLVGDIELISLYLKNEMDDEGNPKFDLEKLGPNEQKAFDKLEEPARHGAINLNVVRTKYAFNLVK